jgi:hypothetical protein
VYAIMELKKRDLNKVRRNLPTGWKAILAEKCAVSTSMVEKVMLGLRKNVLVVHTSIYLSNLKPEIKIELLGKLKESKNELY